MAVRNWYITAEMDDGRVVATGPPSKTDGFTVTVEQRAKGEPTTALNVYGIVMSDGRLKLAGTK